MYTHSAMYMYMFSAVYMYTYSAVYMCGNTAVALGEFGHSSTSDTEHSTGVV